MTTSSLACPRRAALISAVTLLLAGLPGCGDPVIVHNTLENHSNYDVVTRKSAQNPLDHAYLVIDCRNDGVVDARSGDATAGTDVEVLLEADRSDVKVSALWVEGTTRSGASWVSPKFGHDLSISGVRAYVEMHDGKLEVSGIGPVITGGGRSVAMCASARCDAVLSHLVFEPGLPPGQRPASCNAKSTAQYIPKPVDSTSCQRDAYLAAAELECWTAWCISMTAFTADETSVMEDKVAGYCQSAETNVDSALALCSTGGSLGNGTCATSSWGGAVGCP